MNQTIHTLLFGIVALGNLFYLTALIPAWF